MQITVTRTLAVRTSTHPPAVSPAMSGVFDDSVTVGGTVTVAVAGDGSEVGVGAVG